MGDAEMKTRMERTVWEQGQKTESFWKRTSAWMPWLGAIIVCTSAIIFATRAQEFVAEPCGEHVATAVKILGVRLDWDQSFENKATVGRVRVTFEIDLEEPCCIEVTADWYVAKELKVPRWRSRICHSIGKGIHVYDLGTLALPGLGSATMANAFILWIPAEPAEVCSKDAEPGLSFLGWQGGPFPVQTGLSIEAIKFNDLNGNEYFDADETGLPGWTIQLYGEMEGVVLSEGKTDAKGKAVFSDLLPGKYLLREVEQPSWTFTTGTQQSVILLPTNPRPTVYFGNRQIVADIAVTKYVDSDPAIAGERLTYTIKVKNWGPSSAEQVLVKENYPPGYEFLEADPAPDAGTNNVWNLGNLLPGEERTIVVLGFVNPGESGPLINTVWVSSATPDPGQRNNEVTVVTAVEIVADLILDKTVNPLVAKPGEAITYSLTVYNKGPSDAPNVVLTEFYPSGFQFIQAIPTPDPETNNRWTLGKLTVGQSKSIVVVGTSTMNASGTFVNTGLVELAPSQSGAPVGRDPYPSNNLAKANNIVAFYVGFTGWVATGLWHVQRGATCFVCTGPSVEFGDEYVQFARPVEACAFRTYELGQARSLGILTSPIIWPPPNASGWVLISVDFYRQVEKERPSGDYDKTYVQISIEGRPWQTIWYRSSRDGPEECGTITYAIPFVPNYFQMRFVFDSVDGRYNHYKGWALANLWIAVVPSGGTHSSP